ncbi:Vegetative incompatibility protein HET-E-1, partial [Diplodia seriata]
EHDRRLQSKAQGTCEWIQQNQTFLHWRDLPASTTPEKLLLISGTHGCGKSVLASAITEQFENEGRRTLFFYFWSGDTNRQKADQVARSFLAQLLRHDPGDRVSGTVAGLRHVEGQPSSLGLWKTLKSALRIEPIPTFCVLDGIDEASEQKEILANLSDLLEEVPNAKCLMLGRPQVFDALPPLISERKWFLTMNSILTQQDIETFITQELGKVGPIQAAGLQQAAFHTLQENSSGMFLWVRLMISDLEKSCSKFELEERLQSVPQSLEEAYRLLFTRLSQRLDVREVRKTQVTLSLIIAARRPLLTEELVYAVALWTRSNSKATSEPLGKFLPIDSGKSILRGCEEMVSMSSGTVHLNHTSVMEFLCRDRSQWTGSKDEHLAGFHVQVPEVHGLFASLCLDYMDLHDLGCPMKELDTLTDLRQKHPFVEYASYSVFFHLKESSEGFLGVVDKLKRIATSAHLISWIEHAASSWMEHAFGEAQASDNGYAEEFFQEWQALIDSDDELRHSIIAQLQCEIATRTHGFGANDHRTVFFSNLAYFVSLGSLHSDAQNEPLGSIFGAPAFSSGEEASLQAAEGSSEAVQPPPPQSPPQTISAFYDISRYLQQDKMVPVRSLGLFATLMRHTSRIMDFGKVASDPLMLLFRSILQKASTLPIYVVLGIANFYNDVGKTDQAMQLCQKILPRVDGSGSGAESLTYFLMGRLLKGDCDTALRCYKRAISTRESFMVRVISRQSIARMMNDPDEMLDFFQDLLQKDKERYGTRAKATLETQYQLARTLGLLGRGDEAMELMQLTWNMGSGRPILDDRTTLKAGRQIGRWLQAAGSYEEARGWLELYCKRIGGPTKDNHVWYTWAHFLLAGVMESLYRFEDSLDHAYKAYSTSKANSTLKECSVPKTVPSGYWGPRFFLGQMIVTFICTEKYKNAPNRVQLLLAQGEFYDKDDEVHLELLRHLVLFLNLIGETEEARIIGESFVAAETKWPKEDRSGPSITCRSVVLIIEELFQNTRVAEHYAAEAGKENLRGIEDSKKSIDELRDRARFLNPAGNGSLALIQPVLDIETTNLPEQWWTMAEDTGYEHKVTYAR